MNLRAKFSPDIIYVFDKVKAIFPDAILAGGALRDLCLNRPIRDLDIFVELNQTPADPRRVADVFSTSIGSYFKDSEAFWKNIFGSELYGVDVHDANPGEFDEDSGYGNPHMAGRHKLQVNRTTVDIIFCLHPPMEYFETTFDFHLCKALYDGESYTYTSGFIADAMNQTITLCGLKDLDRIESSLKNHLPKIQKKYSGWQSIVPPEYQEVIRKGGRTLCL